MLNSDKIQIATCLDSNSTIKFKDQMGSRAFSGDFEEAGFNGMFNGWI